MFDTGGTTELANWVAQLAGLPRDVTDEQRVSRIRLLEEIKSAAAAAQARDAADLDASRRAQHAKAGKPNARWGEGAAAEVALARRLSPHKGGQLLGLAKTLTADMPHTLALMTAGRLSEWRATILVRETVCLEAADRRAIDAELCGGQSPRAEELGDVALGAAAKRLATRLDAASVVARAARAEKERCVTIRPAPDAMTWVSALLPVAAGVGVYAALKRVADLAPGQSDPRSRGQVMADTLVERVTGRNPLERPVDLDLRIVLPASTLLGGSADQSSADQSSADQSSADQSSADRFDEPAHIPGYGPVPGPWVRRLITEASLDEQTRVLVRQLYAGPRGGLVAMAAKSRVAPRGLAELIALRDQRCRTPWCDAPVRHIDHVVPWDDGGKTEASNLQGLCERCNHARQAPGWQGKPVEDTKVGPAEAHEVDIVTPTGHRYRSTAPPLPGPWSPQPPPIEVSPTEAGPVSSPVERHLSLLLAA